MPPVQCQYLLCYDNDNLQHLCLRSSTSFDFTGVCEYLQHCDAYDCGSCDRFSVCTKEKKDEYLQESEEYEEE